MGAPRGRYRARPESRKRFTRKLFDLSQFRLGDLSDTSLPLDIAVQHKDARLRLRGVRNTVYGSDRSLPPRSFIEVSSGIAISCPELLFIETAGEMPPIQHLMLGHELCGSFSRDAEDPLNGPVVLRCPPATNCKKKERYLEETKRSMHASRAAETLSRLSDNAWSPTESVVAAIASLPYEEFGYGLGPCALNQRIEASGDLSAAAERGSRVPYLVFEGAPVGLNYDGAVHLDLGSVVEAAIQLERHPGQAGLQHALDSVVRDVRAKAIDDIRRNRELAAEGYIVFPVTKEDLYEEGGLDKVMLQVMKTIENLTGKDLSEQRRLLEIRFCCEKRQELIWSVLPGRHPIRIKCTQDARRPSVSEIEIGF